MVKNVEFGACQGCSLSTGHGHGGGNGMLGQAKCQLGCTEEVGFYSTHIVVVALRYVLVQPIRRLSESTTGPSPAATRRSPSQHRYVSSSVVGTGHMSTEDSRRDRERMCTLSEILWADSRNSMVPSANIEYLARPASTGLPWATTAGTGWAVQGSWG